MALPQDLQINGWSGTEVSNISPTDMSFAESILSQPPRRDKDLWPTKIDTTKWASPEVGWGLVLPDNDALSEKERASGADAPPPLRKLLAARPGSPVLRYRPDTRLGLIRRYYNDGSGKQDLQIGTNFGVDRTRVPLYLLMYASPEQIPWSYQYVLQVSHYVGRLDLDGSALHHYVEALIAGWPNSADVTRTLAWAADDKMGAKDITRKMRTAVSFPIAQAWSKDSNLSAGTKFLDGGTTNDATTSNLINALESHKPAMIVTSSHGMTGPLDDLPRMQADLGLLVDRDRMILRPAKLLSNWKPAGAIWYSHACCSAGTDGETAFDGLVAQGSDVDRILKGVAKCGAMVSPLPRALLGSDQPLRAFIGHVEPTFDWSISRRETGQLLTDCLVQALYKDIYLGIPIGMALNRCRAFAAQLLAIWDGARQKFIAGDENSSELLAIKLMHNDWRAFVLIGDPTVTLPIPQN